MSVSRSSDSAMPDADIEIRIGTFRELESDLWHVRRTVFVIEQNVPEEIETDDRDAVCTHVVAYLESQPVGTGRVDFAKDGKVGRVAVLKAFRRRGVGHRIMREIETLAREAGMGKLWFHAQTSAIPFYESLGYQADGGVFYEADIPHRRMEKTLD